jgi:hypothetical protein
MTEEEWLASESPQKMREHLEEKVGTSERKLRLFACTCCRRVARWFLDSCLHLAVDVLERYADGAATAGELATACANADQFDEGHALLSEELNGSRPSALDAAWDAARAVAQATSNDPPGEGEPTYFHRLYDTIMHTVDAAGEGAIVDDPQHGRSLPAQAAERNALASALRDVFGNPFRPVTLDPAWRTGTAVSLARTMYESRDFSAMPILADALQDAGCDSSDILNHCRDTNAPHVRGCWVVDLLLGKC